MKRSLVISVGGSKGAYAGGIVQYYMENKKQYDNFYGSSIGSLIIPFSTQENYHKLRDSFLSIKMDDIFSINPFKIKKTDNGMFKYSINYLNVVRNIIIRKNISLGDTKKLRTDLIPKIFTKKDYDILINLNKEVKIMVTNMSLGTLETKNIKHCTYEDFCNWMWVSTCAPPFMSVPYIGKYHYSDGGIMSQVPIKQAILDGSDEIDVIVLGKEKNDWNIEHIRNSFHYQIKLLLLMMNKIRDYQIDIGYLMHHTNKKIQINFHYTNSTLTNNSLIFDNKLMNLWWDQGYEYAANNECISYIIDGNNKQFIKI